MRALLVFTIAAVTWSLLAQANVSPAKCIVPSSAEQSGPSGGDVAGHYTAVSEAEWNLEVWLHPDGTAEILSEGWEAGHHDKRSSVRHRGTWSLTGAFVELRYTGRCETLRYDPALSFAEFGSEGAAPGLQGQHSSVSFNLFLGRSLWVAQRIREIPKVE